MVTWSSEQQKYESILTRLEDLVDRMKRTKVVITVEDAEDLKKALETPVK